MSALTAMDRLSRDEIERFRDAGIVIPRYRLPSARIDGLRATLDRLIAANPTVRPERLVSVHIEGRNSEGVRGSRDFLALAREPAILDLVEQLIGPDIILWGCQIFCKPGQAVKPGEFDPSTALDVELEPGQMSMHDVYLIHGSNPNRSPKRRAGVAIRYMPATSLFDRGLMARSAASGYTVDFTSRPIWLLRGVDRTGRNDFRVGHRPELASA